MTYTFRITDNIFFNMFETNSKYDAMQQLENRIRESKMVATFLNKDTGDIQKYKWDWEAKEIKKTK